MKISNIIMNDYDFCGIMCVTSVSNDDEQRLRRWHVVRIAEYNLMYEICVLPGWACTQWLGVIQTYVNGIAHLRMREERTI